MKSIFRIPYFRLFVNNPRQFALSGINILLLFTIPRFEAYRFPHGIYRQDKRRDDLQRSRKSRCRRGKAFRHANIRRNLPPAFHRRRRDRRMRRPYLRRLSNRPLLQFFRRFLSGVSLKHKTSILQNRRIFRRECRLYEFFFEASTSRRPVAPLAKLTSTDWWSTTLLSHL